ncbi:MAG: hypothetical protein KAS72_11385 [Phycisphaerales bacterium]|nr:hypothetical protein [Phycisphaerales bacterium]
MIRVLVVDDSAFMRKAIKEVGGQIIAQNEGACVVYGMPKAVTQAGTVTASLEPPSIGRTVRQFVRPNRLAPGMPRLSGPTTHRRVGQRPSSLGVHLAGILRQWAICRSRGYVAH